MSSRNLTNPLQCNYARHHVEVEQCVSKYARVNGIRERERERERERDATYVLALAEHRHVLASVVINSEAPCVLVDILWM